VDEEGFSIPPPDRTPWTEVPGGTSLHEDEGDENADASSIMSTNRFRVDIMNETVKEDAEATHALTRVATLLKEVGAFRKRSDQQNNTIAKNKSH
jgi:F-BAR domain only protein